jgi:hypothetical protein
MYQSHRQPTILWNQHVKADRTIPNKKQDNIIRDHGKGTRLLINIPISRDGTVIQKEGEIILKYEDPPTEIRSMWTVLLGTAHLLRKVLM